MICRNHVKFLFFLGIDTFIWQWVERKWEREGDVMCSNGPTAGICTGWHVCRVLSFVMFWFWIYVFVSCLVVSCFDIPWPSVSFKFLLCSPLWLPLSVVLFPHGFLLYAPVPRYHTWPPPSSLSSPVPCWFISVCVFSLFVPFTPCPAIVFVCVCSRLLPVPLGMCFWIFAFWFELCFWFVLCPVSFALCLAVTFFFPGLWRFMLLGFFCTPVFFCGFQLLFNKARFCFPISLPPLSNCVLLSSCFPLLPNLTLGSTAYVACALNHSTTCTPCEVSLMQTIRFGSRISGVWCWTAKKTCWFVISSTYTVHH